MTTPSPSEDILGQMKIAHLGMVQGIVARLSGFSASAKNFCITIVAALVAVAFQKPVPGLIWAGVAVPLLFAALDAYYLAQERRFRDYYNEICARSLVDCADMRITPTPLQKRSIVKAFFSVSVFVIYAAFALGMCFLLCLAGPTRGAEPNVHASPTVSSTADQKIASGKAAAARLQGRDHAGLAGQRLMTGRP